MAEIFPARAQRVTVLGLTRNIAATSEGVRRASSSWGCMGSTSVLEGSHVSVWAWLIPSRRASSVPYPTSVTTDHCHPVPHGGDGPSLRIHARLVGRVLPKLRRCNG